MLGFTRLPTQRVRAVGSKNAGDGSGLERARAEIIASFDDGESAVAFAKGATVIVMRGSDPVEMRVRNLKEGDNRNS